MPSALRPGAEFGKSGVPMGRTFEPFPFPQPDGLWKEGKKSGRCGSGARLPKFLSHHP